MHCLICPVPAQCHPKQHIPCSWFIWDVSTKKIIWQLHQSPTEKCFVKAIWNTYTFFTIKVWVCKQKKQEIKFLEFDNIIMWYAFTNPHYMMNLSDLWLNHSHYIERYEAFQGLYVGDQVDWHWSRSWALMDQRRSSTTTWHYLHLNDLEAFWNMVEVVCGERVIERSSLDLLGRHSWELLPLEQRIF